VDDTDEHLDLRDTQSGCGLVHDEDVDIGGKGLGDFDDLLLADPVIADRRPAKCRFEGISRYVQGSAS